MATAGDALRSLPPSPSLSQTSIIAACMVVGFFVYITCKGQLSSYMKLFVGNSGTS